MASYKQRQLRLPENLTIKRYLFFLPFCYQIALTTTTTTTTTTSFPPPKKVKYVAPDLKDSNKPIQSLFINIETQQHKCQLH
jgi:hypothetical protein